MAWRRRIRLTLLLVWLLVLGAVAYLASHTYLLAPVAGRLASRNLFPDGRGSVRLRDFRVDLTRGGALHQLVFSLDRDGQVTLVTVDTLLLEYRLAELLGRPTHLRGLHAKGVRVHATLPAEVRRPGRPARQSAPPPQLRVDRVELDGIAVELLDSDGGLRERIPAANFLGRLRADSVLTITILAAAADWRTRACRLSDVTGRVTVGAGEVSISELGARLNESAVLVSGRRSRDGRLRLQVRGDAISADELERILRTRLGFAAQGDLVATVTVRGDSTRFHGSFDGELEGYTLVGMRGAGSLVSDILNWTELEGRVNGALFSGTGRFDLTSADAVRFELTGDVADVDLAAGLVPGVALPTSDGHGRLWLVRDDASDQTTVQGWLADGRLDRVPFDTCRVDVRVQRGAVDLRRINFLYAGQRAELTGQLDAEGAFAGDLMLAIDAVDRLPRQLGLPAARGSVYGGGQVTGRDPEYGFAGRLAMRDGALSVVRFDSAAVDLVVADLLGAWHATGVVDGAGLDVGGVPLGSFALRGRASAREARVDSLGAARGDSALALKLEATYGDGGGWINLEELAIDFEGTRWQTEAPVQFRWAPSGYELQDGRLISELGSLRAHGITDGATGTVDGAVVLERFDLRLLNPFLPRRLRLEGDLTAAAAVVGTLERPVFAIAADLTGTQFELARLDSLHVSATLAQDTLAISTLDLRSNHGRLRASGLVSHRGARRLADFWPGADLDLELAVAEADWAFIDQFKIPALDRIAGRFAARLHVAGTSRAPRVAGRLTSAPFHVHWLHLDTLSGRLELVHDRLTLADLTGRQDGLQLNGRFDIPLKADFLSEPVTPPDGPFRMELTIPDGSDLGPLAQATNAFIESGGRGGMTVVAAGPLEHPSFRGNGWLEGGRCVLKGLEEIYQDVSARATWDGDYLRLREIRGREGARGTFTGEGTLRFYGLMLTGFDVELAVDRFLVASIPELRALVKSPKVRLAGVKVGPDSVMVPKFTGDLEVIQARYTGDFSEKPSLTDPRVATLAPDWLADLRLVGPPRTTLIENRAMELAMSGDVDLVRDLDGMYLRGSMDIDSGRLPVFNNDFRVARGRLDFSREVGVVPRVEMTAETTVRVHSDGPYAGRRLEKITVLVTGNLDQPQIEFQSESGYSRANIERLLLGLAPDAAETPVGGGLRDASIAAGFNLLEREIAAELNIVDTFDIESGRVATTGETSTLIGVGKYLGQDLYVRYAQGLSSEAERDLFIEYQISDHLLLQSGMSRRLDVLQGTTTYNLDLKYRFEY